MVGGNIDYEGVLAGGPDAVLKAIRDCIERTDLEFGEVYYISDFQYDLGNWSIVGVMLILN